MTEANRRIVVSVAADGTVTAETKDVHGSSCLNYIDILEQLLEAATVDSRFTEDFVTSTNKALHEQQESRYDLDEI